MKQSTQTLSRRYLVVSSAGVAALGLAPRPAAAAYPDGTVTLVVCFAPGGATDLVARVLSAPLPDRIGQTVVVRNRAGAGGNVGIGDVAHAKPDGYTFLVASSAFVVNPSLYSSVPYDPFTMVPVADLGASPNAIVTKPDSGIATFDDMVRTAKAKPGTLTYSSAGNGTTPMLGMELIKLRAGIDITHVPFDGAGPAMVSVLGGQTQLASLNIAVAIGQIRSGALKALAQTGTTRWPDLPNVPTLDQVGITGADSETFQAMFAPPRTPAPLVALMSGKVVDIMGDPATKAKLLTAGFAVAAGGPDVLKARIAREVPMWRDVIRTAHLTVG